MNTREMILIADNNEDVRRIIRRVIEEIDAEVIEVADGTEAIEAYEDRRPDWVLMDINMHPMDGLTAMSEILRQHPDARVVIVSQHQDARTRETALAMGAYAFVGKEDLMKLQDLLAPTLVNIKRQ
ncbi:MAG TPA: response regulator [Pyrinomonadaceae bacterium]|nr:response regulator [Pyrinomonadaceae bacterium]